METSTPPPSYDSVVSTDSQEYTTTPTMHVFWTQGNFGPTQMPVNGYPGPPPVYLLVDNHNIDCPADNIAEGQTHVETPAEKTNGVSRTRSGLDGFCVVYCFYAVIAIFVLGFYLTKSGLL